MLMNERTKHILKDLHDEFGTLDPFYIIEMSGITLDYVPFIKNTKGLYTKLIDEPIIFLDEKLQHSNERYFIASHELCHAIEHDEIAGFYTLNKRSNSKIETEANLFATLLCFNLYIEEHGKSSFTIKDLKARYGVPYGLSELFL